MDVIYNEIDSGAAAWLSQLGREGAIPRGRVDMRSIIDIRGHDVAKARQAHFFAGIGGWAYALRLAGYEHLACWTGSPPCQPFSTAGQQRGKDDDRHLAPVWLNLIRERRPPVLLGEQVADAIRHGWLDDLFDALEECGYACGAAVLPACSVGAPHIRKRLFFGAVRLGNTSDILGRQCDFGSMGGPQRALSGKTRSRYGDALGTSGSVDELADTDCAGLFEQWRSKSVQPEYTASEYTGQNNRANPHHSFWSGADWLGCRDGKFRPVEPQVLGMVDGVPDGMVRSGIVSASSPLAERQEARVMRLRGYGNAIVPAVAAVFIREFMEAARCV